MAVARMGAAILLGCAACHGRVDPAPVARAPVCEPVVALRPVPPGYPGRMPRLGDDDQAALAKRLSAETGWTVTVDALGFIASATHAGDPGIVGSLERHAPMSEGELALVTRFLAANLPRMGLRDPAIARGIDPKASWLVPSELAAWPVDDPGGMPVRARGLVHDRPPVAIEKQHTGSTDTVDQYVLTILGHGLAGLPLPAAPVLTESALLARWAARPITSEAVPPGTCDFGCTRPGKPSAPMKAHRRLRPMVAFLPGSDGDLAVRRVAIVETVVEVPIYNDGGGPIPPEPDPCIPEVVDRVTGVAVTVPESTMLLFADPDRT